LLDLGVIRFIEMMIKISSDQKFMGIGSGWTLQQNEEWSRLTLRTRGVGRAGTADPGQANQLAMRHFIHKWRTRRLQYATFRHVHGRSTHVFHRRGRTDVLHESVNIDKLCSITMLAKQHYDTMHFAKQQWREDAMTLR